MIAVRVDNRHRPDVPPLNANFNFYGGVYCGVWLVATEPVPFDMLDHGSPCVFIDTPEMTADRATVRIRGAVVNETTAQKQVVVSYRLIDASNHEVAAGRATLSIGRGSRASSDQRSEPIAHPRLWSPASPYLYRVQTEIRDDGGAKTSRTSWD